MLSLIKKNFYLILPILLLVIFTISIWDGNYYVGGDLMYPLNPKNTILKSIYLWGEQNGGQSFSFDYCRLLWQLPFYLFSMLSIPAAFGEKIFIIGMFGMGFIFTYQTYKILFKSTKFGNHQFAFLAAILFCLNPVVFLMPNAYPPLFAFPVCYYFLIKYFDTKKVFYLVPFFLFINFAFYSDFPQPKVFLFFCLSLILLVYLYLYLRKTTIFNLIPQFLTIIILGVLLNAFIILPFSHGMFGKSGAYNYFSSSGNIYGGRADLYSSALPYISRFYNGNFVNDQSKIGQFLQNPFFTTWTFFFWFVILIGTLLNKDKKSKKLCYLLLLGTLVFIFMAKGPNPPFERIYTYFLFHFPLFKIIRTTATIIFGGVLFYVFLLTISIFYITQKFPKFFYIFLFIHLFIFYPIVFGYQFQTGGKIYQKGISIPEEYFTMGKTLDNLKDNNNVLVLPLDAGYLNKSWLYTGTSLMPWITKKPIINNNVSINRDIDNLSPSPFCFFTSIYNIGYLLWEKDTTSTTFNKEQLSFGKPLVDNKYFNLSSLDKTCTLPSIYIPDQIISFKGIPNDIFLLDSYIDKNAKPLIINSLGNDDSSIIPNLTNKLIVETSPINTSLDLRGRNYLRLYLGSENLINEIYYPSVYIKPNFPLYSLLLFKEQLSENSDNADDRQRIDKKLFFATKRISEIDVWGINNDWWRQSLERYRQKITEAIQIAVNSGDRKDNLELIVEYIDHHRQKIQKIIQSGAFWDKEKIEAWENIFKDLNNKAIISYKPLQFTHYDYIVKPPVKGNYQLFLDDFGAGFQGDIYLNGVKINPGTRLDPLANSYFLDLLDNKITIDNLSYPNLLNPRKWIPVQQKTGVLVDPSIIVHNNQDQLEPQTQIYLPEVSQVISGWEKNKTYLFKINYRNTNKAILKVSVIETKEIYNQRDEAWGTEETNIVNEPLGTDAFGKGGKFLALLKADKNSLGATVYIDGINGITEIESLELQEIPNPRIILQLTNPKAASQSASQPKIEFIKINPTKYQVKINQADKPYYLVFSEAFNTEWKIKNNQNNREIPESRHYLANGYANAWYVDVQDNNGQNSYTMTIEYTPQRLFYIGIAITLITIGGLIIYTYVKKY